MAAATKAELAAEVARLRAALERVEALAVGRTVAVPLADEELEAIRPGLDDLVCDWLGEGSTISGAWPGGPGDPPCVRQFRIEGGDADYRGIGLPAYDGYVVRYEYDHCDGASLVRAWGVLRPR